MLMSYFGMLLTLQSRGLQIMECMDHISHICCKQWVHNRKPAGLCGWPVSLCIVYVDVIFWNVAYAAKSRSAVYGMCGSHITHISKQWVHNRKPAGWCGWPIHFPLLLETQNIYISLKNSHFFNYLLYAKSKYTWNRFIIKKSLSMRLSAEERRR